MKTSLSRWWREAALLSVKGTNVHRVFLLKLMLLVFLTSLCGRAVEAAEDLSEKTRLLLDYQAFMRGDRDGGVRFSLSASRDLQGTPLAELAVRIAMMYDPAWLSNVSMGEAEARRILNNEAELSPGHRDILRRFVARSFAAAGRREDSMQMHARRGLAMSWLAAGPFVGRNGAGFETRRIPEGGEVVETDVMTNLPDAETFRRWRKNPPWRRIPDNRSFPFVRPWKISGRDDDGAMLMFTSVDMSEADSKAFFQIYSETSWRLYVDGALLAEVDRNGREVPVEHEVAYSMSQGRHTVMLQLFPPALGEDRENVRVSLLLHSDSSFVWDCTAAKPEPVRTVSSRREARPLRYLVELRDAAESGKPILSAAYALALIEQRMYDEASWWAEQAAEAEPSVALLQYIAGLAVGMNQLLPVERRLDMAAAWHRRALECKPDLVPSLLFMADREADAGRALEASDYIKRAYAVNPGSIDVLMARGEWARQFASGATAKAAWDECAKAFANSSAVQLSIASAPQEGFLDMERRIQTCRAAQAAGPYVAEASMLLADALADSGNTQEAESVLRDALELFAGEVTVLHRIAEIYARLGNYEQAIAVLSDAVRITPDNEALWRRLGDFHMDAGRQDEAAKLWRVSLAASPGQFQLADMLDFLAGDGERFHNEGGHDAIVMTAEADPEEYTGDVVRLLDRAVLTFVHDGSYRRLSHELDLARTRRGGESLTGIDTKGELLTARIVFPNGNTLEPEPFPGTGGLRLPVIMPGAAREVRVLESMSASGMGAPLVKPWFFQDPSGRMPLLISEYIVRTPRNFPLVYSVSNLGSAVDYELVQEGEFDIHRWAAKLSLPSFEPDAVHISERVPSVEIGVKTSWDDVVFQELRRLEGKLLPSMRMRETLANLYQTSPDARPDPLAAARAIYRYVCDNIDATPAGRIAAHIHMDRMGDRRLLLLAMLRAAGLDAYPAAARPSAQYMHPPTWELPSSDIFTIPMVRLTVPAGGTYWLDVRFDSLPFGKIIDDLSGATVLSYLPTGPLFETLPSLPAEDSIIYKERSIRLPAKDDRLDVSGRSLRRGVAGLLREQEMDGADADTRKNVMLASLFPIFPDAELLQFDVQRTDDTEASSLERYEITAASALETRPDGSLAVPLCFLPPSVISDETRNLTTRQTACHIRAVHIAEDRNVFRLPDNGHFTRVPMAAHIPSRFGVYQLRISQRGDKSLEIIRNYHIPAQRIMPWDWTDFLAFLEKVDLAEKQWIEYAVRE